MFTSNVRRFAHKIREILDFLRWDEQDDAAAQEANLSAFDDPTSKSVQLSDGGWKMVQRKRRPTTIDALCMYCRVSLYGQLNRDDTP